jgi:SNF2 family DNA or RNA helicase
VTAVRRNGGGGGGGVRKGGGESGGDSEEGSDDGSDEDYRAGKKKSKRKVDAPTSPSFSSSSSNGEWQPVDERVIEGQCKGLRAIKPYQCVGVNWLLLLHHQRVSGVLADDMGLGVCACAHPNFFPPSLPSPLVVIFVKVLFAVFVWCFARAPSPWAGKTVQTIAFFAMLKRNARASGQETPCHLVVVPASVLSNWQGELERFAPHLNVVAYHGE